MQHLWQKSYRKNVLPDSREKKTSLKTIIKTLCSTFHVSSQQQWMMKSFLTTSEKIKRTDTYFTSTQSTLKHLNDVKNNKNKNHFDNKKWFPPKTNSMQIFKKPHTKIETIKWNAEWQPSDDVHIMIFICCVVESLSEW